MSTTTAAPNCATLDAAVGRVYGQLYGVLNSLPESRLDARRVIVEQLGLDPTADELRAITRLTHDDAGRGALQELSRSALAMKILADRELTEIFDSKRLNRDRLERSSEMMPALLKTVKTLEEEMHSRLQAVDDSEREFLVEMRKILVPPRAPLIAASLMAPRLAALAAMTSVAELTGAHPSLTPQEATLVLSAVGEGQPLDEFRRSCLNALALRTIIEKDLAGLDALRGSHAEDPGALEPRAAVVLRLERDKVAYDVFAERLQERQDRALVEGALDKAKKLREAKQSLFSTNVKLVAALRDPSGPAPADPADREADSSARLRELLDRCAAGDAMAEVERGKSSTDELCLNAVKRLRTPPPEPEAGMGMEQLQTERRRVRALSSVAAVLVVALVGVYATMMGGRLPDPEIRPAEFPRTAAVARAVVVGPMMYTQVRRGDWDDLSETDRLARVDDLGRTAGERGLETVYVTDESNADLARWTQNDGSKLLQSRGD